MPVISLYLDQPKALTLEDPTLEPQNIAVCGVLFDSSTVQHSDGSHAYFSEVSRLNDRQISVAGTSNQRCAESKTLNLVQSQMSVYSSEAVFEGERGISDAASKALKKWIRDLLIHPTMNDSISVAATGSMGGGSILIVTNGRRSKQVTIRFDSAGSTTCVTYVTAWSSKQGMDADQGAVLKWLGP